MMIEIPKVDKDKNPKYATVKKVSITRRWCGVIIFCVVPVVDLQQTPTTLKLDPQKEDKNT